MFKSWKINGKLISLALLLIGSSKYDLFFVWLSLAVKVFFALQSQNEAVDTVIIGLFSETDVLCWEMY